MKLYIFEPYIWLNCGGSLMAIANTFDQAVDVITNNNKAFLGIFQQDAKKFKDYNQPNSYRWILTHKFEIEDDGEPRIIVDNWYN